MSYNQFAGVLEFGIHGSAEEEIENRAL